MSRDDLGKLLLRVTVGVLILLHGIAKIRYGIGGIERMLITNNMPGFLAWGVYIGEVIAPVLMILGFYARAGGLIVAMNMVIAVLLAHSNQINSFNAQGIWTLELQGMFLVGALTVGLIGAGRYSLGGSSGPWN
ncbi:DoxX family protein [Alcaligenes faecalis]|uniref:DoxX family protein n=1 Tax=Alcaligenes faecalis TaxID=511 RepID=UPI0029323B77|nr:DoxX family protein [Alcaligenes faecalis]MDV2117372.1 DoxX family protein [Alcaligenes faecalis]